jgi:hypothetical protein
MKPQFTFGIPVLSLTIRDERANLKIRADRRGRQSGKRRIPLRLVAFRTKFRRAS